MRRSLKIVAWAVLLATIGCRDRTPNADRGVAAEGRSSPRAVRCDLSVWTDMVAARNDREVQQLRGRLLAGSPEAAALASKSELGLERYAQSATMCNVSSGLPQPSRIMTFEGTFPPGLLDEWSSSIPGARWETVSGKRVLRAGSAWVSLSGSVLVWADSRDGLAAAVTGNVAATEIDRSKLLWVRMHPTGKLLDWQQLARALEVDEAQWAFVTVSVDEGGSGAEFSITAKSPSATARILSIFRSTLEDLSSAPIAMRPANLDHISVEANGSTVSLRYAGTLRELLHFLTQLRPRRTASHHP